METFLIIAIPISAIALIVVTVIFAKRKVAATDLRVAQNGNVAISIEQLTAFSDYSTLSEIADTTVISRLKQAIPITEEQAAKNSNIYRAIIPNGETLMQLKNMAAANVGANVMNVGSLVVGQYYMSEINTRLDTMNRNIDKISDFQNREFKSRIVSLAALVGEISQFSVEVIENDELRLLKLSALESMKANATELLGQVNETIIGMCKSNQNPDYETYQSTVDDFDILTEHQKILLMILEEISKLNYLLGKGNISNEICYSLFYKYFDLSLKADNQLEEWHDIQVINHKIDLDKNRKPKSGLEGFFANVPAIWDDNFKYKELKCGLADKITSQIQFKPMTASKQKLIYDSDVQIIIKDGKYYYQHD